MAQAAVPKNATVMIALKNISNGVQKFVPLAAFHIQESGMKIKEHVTGPAALESATQRRLNVISLSKKGEKLYATYPLR